MPSHPPYFQRSQDTWEGLSTTMSYTQIFLDIWEGLITTEFLVHKCHKKRGIPSPHKTSCFLNIVAPQHNQEDIYQQSLASSEPGTFSFSSYFSVFSACRFSVAAGEFWQSHQGDGWGDRDDATQVCADHHTSTAHTRRNRSVLHAHTDCTEFSSSHHKAFIALMLCSKRA